MKKLLIISAFFTDYVKIMRRRGKNIINKKITRNYALREE